MDDDTGGRDKRAFGLPEYSVRAVLILMFVMISGTLLIMGKTIPEWWVSLVSMMLAFYFKR